MYGKKRYQKRSVDKSVPRNRKDFNQDKRIKKVEKKIHQLENSEELKYFDLIAATPAIVTGLLTVVNAMGTGSSQDTRVGAQIKMTSVQFRFVLTNLAATLAPTVCRFMVVLDRINTGSLPNVAADASAGSVAILDNGVITNLVDSPYQYEQKERFKILHDKRYVFNPQQDLTTAAGTVTVNQQVSKAINGYIKLNKIVKYDATAAAIGSMNANALYTLFITDTANGITITGGTRIYFKDA